MKFGICILVGGKSSRMNYFPKADLTYNGKKFLDILVEEMATFTNKYISINTSQTYSYPGYQTIVDEYEEIGPLSGIVSTFHQSDVDALFVCSCDMPRIKKEMVLFLYEQLKNYHGIFMEDENHTYVTTGIYTRNMLPQMESQIEKGDYRLYRCVQSQNCKIINIQDCDVDRNMFKNINTIEEYHCLEEDL